MKTEPNENAFPCEYDCSHNAQKESVQGLTKREYLIFQIYSRSTVAGIHKYDKLPLGIMELIAKESVQAADILFTELNK